MSLETVGGTSPQDGISRLTTEYIYWPINSTDDFSAATASVAFMESSTAKPGVSDWQAASIVENPDNSLADAVRILVGPATGGYDLTPATAESLTYHIFIRISTGTEVIVRRAGTLTVR